MTQTSTSPNFDHPPVETLFTQYLAASGNALQARLAQQICLELTQRIAFRRAELAGDVSRAVVQTPAIPPLNAAKRQAAYALH